MFFFSSKPKITRTRLDDDEYKLLEFLDAVDPAQLDAFDTLMIYMIEHGTSALNAVLGAQYGVDIYTITERNQELHRYLTELFTVIDPLKIPKIPFYIQWINRYGISRFECELLRKYSIVTEILNQRTNTSGTPGLL